MKSTQLLCLSLALVTHRALFADTAPGFVIGWGNNGSGQATGTPSLVLSNGTFLTVGNLFATGTVTVAGEVLSDAVEIAAGMSHGLALRNDGSLVGWGGNSTGQAVGYETPYPHRASGQVRIGGRVLANIADISAGRTHSLALDRDGAVYGWGNNQDGQATPPADLGNVISVSAGNRHNLALKPDGTALSWGARQNAITGVSNIVAVAALGSWFGNDLALTREGAVIEWRANGKRTTPAGAISIVAISTGHNHYLALRRNGTVFGWGFNAGGEATGIPTTGDSRVASGTVVIGGQILSNVVAVAAGDGHSLALLADGTVTAWGRMNNGLQPATVPVGLSNVVAIAAGPDYCLAITTNKAVADRFRQ